MRPLRRQRQARGGDSWQIIYMDLMTIIMVFFVILWSISQQKDEGVSDTVGDQSVNLVTLPGDVLFASGKSAMSRKGREIFGKIFAHGEDTVMNFDSGGLVKRMLVIHGHTDGDGSKEENLVLGYERAMAAYQEMRKYSEDLADHAVICTHADNSPAQEVPSSSEDLSLSKEERALVYQAKAANRRITIEDKLVNRYSGE